MSFRLSSFVMVAVLCLGTIAVGQEAWVTRGETGILFQYRTVQFEEHEAGAIALGVNIEGYVAVSAGTSDGGSYFRNIDATHISVAGFVAPIERDKSSFALSGNLELILPDENRFVDQVVGLGAMGYYNLLLGSSFRLQPSAGIMMYLPSSQSPFELENLSLIRGGIDVYLRLGDHVSVGGGYNFGAISQEGVSEHVDGVDFGVVIVPAAFRQ